MVQTDWSAYDQCPKCKRRTGDACRNLARRPLHYLDAEHPRYQLDRPHRERPRLSR